MQTIVNKELEPTSENYPITLMTEGYKNVLMLHSTTEIVLWNENIKWRLTPNELLEIMKRQDLVKPFNVVTEL